MKINLMQDYRGILLDDKLMLKGVHEVDDAFGEYLIGKGRATPAAPFASTDSTVERPSQISVHNKAVEELGLPEYLKVADEETEAEPKSKPSRTKK